jgi:hypothetical protein
MAEICGFSILGIRFPRLVAVNSPENKGFSSRNSLQKRFPNLPEILDPLRITIILGTNTTA